MFATKSVLLPIICFYVPNMEASLRRTPPHLLEEGSSGGTSATSLRGEVAQWHVDRLQFAERPASGWLSGVDAITLIVTDRPGPQAGFH